MCRGKIVIILGHPLIPFKPLLRISKMGQINKIESDSTVLVDFIDTKLIQYIKSKEIALAVHVKSIKDACLANAFGVRFIVVDESISKEVQSIATEYLFDSKIILQIENEEGIERAARDLIDGVVLK